MSGAELAGAPERLVAGVYCDDARRPGSLCDHEAQDAHAARTDDHDIVADLHLAVMDDPFPSTGQ